MRQASARIGSVVMMLAISGLAVSMASAQDSGRRNTRPNREPFGNAAGVGNAGETKLRPPRRGSGGDQDSREEPAPEEALGDGPLRAPQARQRFGVEQPEAQPDVTDKPDISLDDEEMLSFDALSGPVQIARLVDLITELLEIPVIVPVEGIEGEVLFNGPRSYPRSQLLPLLELLLEQSGYAITLDSSAGIYVIQRSPQLPRVFDGELATTKVLEVPNIKPSALSASIQQLLASSGSGAGGTARGAGAAGSGTSVNFVDELGLVVVSGSPRQIERVERWIEQIRERFNELTLTPIDLRYISAPVARDRILALVGSSGGAGGGAARSGDQAATQIAAVAGQSIDNLAERLAIDPQGNALLHNGTEDELDRVLRFVSIVDRPNPLQPQDFFAGSNAAQIAQLASSQGLGDVVQLQTQQQGFGGNQFQNAGGGGGFGAGASGAVSIGGPTLVVDAANGGNIVYYGTEEQKEELQKLIDTFDTESDRIVIRQYRLDNADAEEVAGIIQSLLTGQQVGGAQGGLLPGGFGGGFGQQFGGQFGQFGQGQFIPPVGPDGLPDGELNGNLDPTTSFVVPDPSNNQVVVKAPLRQQEDFRKLVNQLDRRRPQVYLEATIVSVTDDEAFTLAIEEEFNIGEFAFQTEFGVGGATPPIVDIVAPGTGVTTAIIQTNFLPFILSALKTKTDARIVSKPQILVNDNESATVVSNNVQPFASITQGVNSDQVGQGGTAEAGTSLNVTPSIAEAGYVRLDYSIESSAFTGASSDPALQPPSIENTVEGSATIPSDSTIVVGGITVSDFTRSKSRVPILGEIPFLGWLFGTTSEEQSETVLYIFITPRVLNDPNFNDLKLLTEGPAIAAELDPFRPALEPRYVELGSLRRRVEAKQAILSERDGRLPGGGG